MSRTELVCLRRREKQLVSQIEDIQDRMVRYDEAKQLELRLSVTRLARRLHQVRYTIRQHEAEA